MTIKTHRLSSNIFYVTNQNKISNVTIFFIFIQPTLHPHHLFLSFRHNRQNGF